MLTLNLPGEGEMLLQRFAKEAGKDCVEYAVEIMMECLGDMEDVQIAQQRLRDIQSGKETTVSLQEVMREYGMEY